MSENDQALAACRDLIRNHRWAALATLSERGVPEASMVAYAFADDLSALYLHLSTLASHTRALLEHPYGALAVSEPDDGRADPQTLARVSLKGNVTEVPADDAEFDAAKARYLARLPEAEMRFGFGDFVLLRFVPEKVRFVVGFAQAFSFKGLDLAAG